MIVTMQKEVHKCSDCPYQSVYRDMGASIKICSAFENIKKVPSDGTPSWCPELIKTKQEKLKRMAEAMNDKTISPAVRIKAAEYVLAVTRPDSTLQREKENK